MDHDYEVEDEYAPRILWGRLAFFLLALVLAFVAGRACAPDGIPADEFEAVQNEAFELASENKILQQQVDAGAAEPETRNNKKDDGDAAAEEPTEAATDEAVGEGKTYTVQSGDTLTTIAEKFYGNASDFTLIVDANNLDDATGLRVGQELVIPPKD